MNKGLRESSEQNSDGYRPETDPIYLMTRPMAERRAALVAGAEAVAHFYAEDLAKPVEERELTAFTALDGEQFLEDYFEMDSDGVPVPH
jgi:hypothetical protein